MRGSVAAGCVLGILVLGVVLAAEVEAPPIFRASEILPPELAQSDDHRVVELVRNDGFMNHFTIKSEFGEFEAVGKPTLAKRVHEVHALATLAEVSKTELFAESAARAATAQVTAVAEFAKRPVETVKGVPGGVKRMFRSYKRDAKEVTAEAKELSEDEDEADGGSEDEENQSAMEDAKDVGTKYAKRYFGTSRAERKWAQELGIDPYTSNEVLIKELKEVARVDAAGGFTMKFAPIPRIPGASLLSAANKIVWTMDPRELQEFNLKRLTEMGASEELLEAFFDNIWLSPSRQTRIVSALVSLEDVGGVIIALEQAAGVESREQAAFFQQSLEMLAHFHRHDEQLDRLQGGTRVPSAITRSGRLVAFASVDHISWTEEMKEAPVDFNEAHPGIQVDGRELVLRGSASEMCRQGLGELGLSVRERFVLEPAEEMQTQG